MRWFEPNLRNVLCEAGDRGLRIGVIVRNVCNMEASLFGTRHPYDKAYGEIYRFLRTECLKPTSPYKYKYKSLSTDKSRGHGLFYFDKAMECNDLQTKLDL